MFTTSFDPLQLKAAIEENRPYQMMFSYVNDYSKFIINQAVSSILNQLKRAYLRNQVRYVTTEVINNANKAVLKRVYFKTRELDIENPDDYKKGMVGFYNEYLEHEEEYTSLAKEMNLYSKIEFLVDKEFLTITVSNTGRPTQEEMKRIEARIEKAQRIRTTQEALDVAGDSTEGAGLGTVTSILLLRGLSNQATRRQPFDFLVDKQNNQTIAQIVLSLDAIPNKVTEQISENIAREIETIPTYPDNVMKLDQMLQNANVPLSQIASIIQQDPALTAELLKVINSAQFVLAQRVKTIQNAVSLVGIQGIRNLLLSFGAKKIFEQKYGKLDELWKHAYRTAFYAYMLAKENRRNNLADDAYLGGILHDVGKIIMKSVDPKLSGKINVIAMTKGIPGEILERLTMGCSHARVGAMVLEKWNFPKPIIDPVAYSYQPLLAEDDNREIVEIVYLADSFAMLSMGRIKTHTLEPEILKKYNLNGPTDMIACVKRLGEMYQRQLNM